MDASHITVTLQLGTLVLVGLAIFRSGRTYQRFEDKLEQQDARLDKVEAKCERMHPPMTHAATAGQD